VLDREIVRREYLPGPPGWTSTDGTDKTFASRFLGKQSFLCDPVI
jgi:hypothetical protein